MAFKYQALNDSHSSLNSLSSLGSSRSIDSPGAGGGGRQRPRLEFSAAGTCGSSNRNSLAIMSEVVDRSFFPAPSSHESERVGEGGVRSDSKWRQSLEVEEKGTKQTSLRAGQRSTDYASSTDSTSGNNTTSSTVLKQKNYDFSDSSEAPNLHNTTHSSSVESETGLYIHSSVRSGGSGLKFSRQVSTPVGAGGDRQTGPPLHHHHNQSREHGKLFKVLQKFSNKRAQQRVEIESEKRARKSPQHSSSRMERGREKENVGHQKRSHKNKQGKKGQFPVSKSSDLLSGFSDVVYQDINTEVVDPLALELEVEPDSIIYANTTTDRLLGGEELSLHHDSTCAQKYPSVPPACEVEENDGSVSRYKRASMRRTSSLNEGVYHGCTCSATMDTGALTKSGVSSLSRNGSRKKSHNLMLCQGESRDLL